MVNLVRASRRGLRDYAKVGLQLFVQRVVIYTAAILLAGAYYSWKTAAIFYVLIALCEGFDFWVFRRIVRRRKWDEANIRNAMIGIYLGTLFSSTSIALFSVSFAMQQGHETGHFMPLFMLVSASIFATMNNHQFVSVLAVRLLIYVSAILFIPIYDVWVVAEPLSSEVWLHLFTVLFVLGFLFELARTFLANYSKALQSRLALENEHERTKAAYKAKTEFLSTVSHELRTPLTSIKGSLSIISSGALGAVPEKMQGPFEIAGRNAQQLANLVDDLLTLQRAEAGKIEFTFEILDIGKLVLEVIERFKPYARSMEVEVHSDITIGEYWARCDGKRIGQVVTNLLSNAAKFSDKDRSIRVSLDRLGDHVKLSVADKGIGIPDGSHKAVFEEFTQLDSTDTRKFEGTGLGLSISKRIVEAHEGQIGYTSKLGVGSTFFVNLLEEDHPIVAIPA